MAPRSTQLDTRRTHFHFHSPRLAGLIACTFVAFDFCLAAAHVDSLSEQHFGRQHAITQMIRWLATIL